MTENQQTLAEFLEHELGVRTEPLFKRSEGSHDPIVTHMTRLWKEQNKNSEEAFLFKATIGLQLIEKVKLLVPKFYTRHGYIVVHVLPKKDAYPRSVLFVLEKEQEKKSISITFEQGMVLITVFPPVSPEK